MTSGVKAPKGRSNVKLGPVRQVQDRTNRLVRRECDERGWLAGMIAGLSDARSNIGPKLHGHFRPEAMIFVVYKIS